MNFIKHISIFNVLKLQPSNKFKPLIIYNEQWIRQSLREKSKKYYDNDNKTLWTLGLSLCGLCAIQQSEFGKSHNLGIAAVVGDPDAQSYLLNAIEEISSGRKVEEVGVTTRSPESKLITTKFGRNRGSDESRHWLPERFECEVVLRNNVTSSGRHIGHTSGIASSKETPSCSCCKSIKTSAQPQYDSKGRIAVVHEGQIANDRELRRELERINQSVFSSHTNAELIAEMIGCYMDRGYDVSDATKQVLSRLDGSWALVVMDKEKHDEVIVAQNGSRLTVGIGDGRMYVASDPELFSKYTNRYISLQDGEFAVVKAEDSSLDLSRTEQLPYKRRTTQDSDLNPAPFEHWTLHDICEQPESLARALGCGSRIAGDTVVLGGLDRNAERLLSINHLTLSAQGSSLFAAEYGAKLMHELGSFDTVQTVQSQNMNKRYIATNSGGACVLSKTGESKVSQVAVKVAKKTNNPVFSIVNSIGSQVAKKTKVGIYLNAGEENGPIATKVFSSQVVALGLVAIWYAQYRQGSPTDARRSLVKALNKVSQNFSSTLECRPQCRAVAQRLFNSRHCFVMGSSFAESIAKEGALMLTMLSHVNAEGCSPGVLRHGTLSLIEDANGKYGRTPVILIILSDEKPEEMRNIAEQVRASGAFTLIITDDEKHAEGVADTCITIPKNGKLTALNALVPLQLLAYELSVLKGLNPDDTLNSLPTSLLRHGSSRAGNEVLPCL